MAKLPFKVSPIGYSLEMHQPRVADLGADEFKFLLQACQPLEIYQPHIGDLGGSPEAERLQVG